MKVYIRKNESIDNAIERFSGKVKKSGVLDEYRAKTAFRTQKEMAREREWQRNKKRSKGRKES